MGNIFIFIEFQASQSEKPRRNVHTYACIKIRSEGCPSVFSTNIYPDQYLRVYERNRAHLNADDRIIKDVVSSTRQAIRHGSYSSFTFLFTVAQEPRKS